MVSLLENDTFDSCFEVVLHIPKYTLIFQMIV